MHFHNLQASYLFLILLALLFLLWLSQKGKKRALETLAQRELLASLMPSVDPRRQRQKAVLSIVALAVGILALMRPQMGFYWEEGKRQGLDILVAMDVSKSMLVEDTKPSRLEYAKQAVKNWVKTLKGDRVGLIAFSGEAFLACPLTTDYSAFMLSLDGMNADTLPRGGTNLSSAIQETLKSYRKGQGEKILLLLSDGEDHGGDLISVTESAQKERIRIYTIGVGTREGGLIPTADKDNQRDFLKDDQGNVVKSRLNEGILERIAAIASGAYVRGGEEGSALKWVYDEKLSKLEKGEFEGSMRKRDREWFQAPIAIALLLSLLELFAGERRPALRPKGRGVLGLALLLFLSSLFACGDKIPEKAYQLYQGGRYEEAQKAYETILANDPGSFLWNYNLAAVLYRRGDYSGAIEHLVKALASDDPSLEAKANYNMGNCKARLAEKAEKTDLEKAIDLYREALDFYQRASDLDKSDKDAYVNHRWVKRRIEYLDGRLKGQELKAPEPKEPAKREEKPDSTSNLSSSPEGPGQREADSQTPGQQTLFKSPRSRLSKGGKGEVSGQQEGNRIEMSKEEAEMLLERCQKEEGPLTLSSMRKGAKALPEVKKPW